MADMPTEIGSYDQSVVEFCMGRKLHSRVEVALCEGIFIIKEKKLWMIEATLL